MSEGKEEGKNSALSMGLKPTTPWFLGKYTLMGELQMIGSGDGFLIKYSESYVSEIINPEFINASKVLAHVVIFMG